MDFTSVTADLNILLSDTDNFAYSTDEKSRALTEAWNDKYVFNDIWDSSLTFSVSTYQYVKPTVLTTIKEVNLSRSVTSNGYVDYPEPIAQNLWKMIAGKLQFDPHARSIIPDQSVLYLRGNYKLAVADSLVTQAQKEYVLALAAFKCLKVLGYKRVNRFLKNDTTMAEIIALKRDCQMEIKDYRMRFQREYEVI